VLKPSWCSILPVSPDAGEFWNENIVDYSGRTTRGRGIIIVAVPDSSSSPPLDRHSQRHLLHEPQLRVIIIFKVEFEDTADGIVAILPPISSSLLFFFILLAVIFFVIVTPE
jgi:hypothetical protein